MKTLTSGGKYQPEGLTSAMLPFKHLLRIPLSLKVRLRSRDLWEKLPQRKKMNRRFPQFNKLNFIKFGPLVAPPLKFSTEHYEDIHTS